MISALGPDVGTSWVNLVAGRGGIAEADRIDLHGLAGEFAGQAPVPAAPDDGARPDRAVELALTAAGEAVRRARLADAGYRPERLGLVVSTSLGGTPTGERFHRAWLADGLAQADARPLTSYTLHAAADAVASAHTLHGPRSVVSNACAAGGVAIGYALELLWGGDADAVLCGGVDPLSLVSFNGFNCLGALDPQPCAPYTRSRGLTLGEGSGFLLLEREDRARARGAELVAAALGYGLTADAHHPTAPDPGGAGAVRAMAVALATAGHRPDAVDYVNGHGTGTPANDAVEPKAIRALFRTPPPVSSTKSLIGHTLGAAGAIEAVCCALAVQHGILPPTLAAGPSRSGLDIVPERGRAAAVMNAAAGHVAVLHRFRGATATVSSGGTSLTCALHYAYRLVRRGAARRVLVLGADEAPEVLLAGYLRRPGYLSRDGVRPFHGGGTVLSAGAVAVLVTSEAEAERAGLQPLAEISGFGLAGDSSGIAGIDRSGAGWAAAFRSALHAADIAPHEVDVVSSSAMGRAVTDRAEPAALHETGLEHRRVVASKSIAGDTGGTAPGVALLAALHAMRTGRLPGTWGVESAPSVLPGLVPAHGAECGTVRHALVSGFAFGGSYQAVVISGWPT